MPHFTGSNGIRLLSSDWDTYVLWWKKKLNGKRTLNTCSLWSTHFVLFLDSAATLQQQACHFCMAFPCCYQKWSATPLHINEGDTMEPNEIDMRNLLVEHHIKWCEYIDNITKNRSHINNKQLGLHNSSTYMCACLLCPCSWCVQRGHKMHQTSSKQWRPTLSTAFTSNPQDLTRYSTMDNWPSWAAKCKAVYPSSSESKRWSSILGARYSAMATWPPPAHIWKALSPPCIKQWEQAHNTSPPVYTCAGTPFWMEGQLCRHI